MDKLTICIKEVISGQGGISSNQALLRVVPTTFANQQVEEVLIEDLGKLKEWAKREWNREELWNQAFFVDNPYFPKTQVMVIELNNYSQTGTRLTIKDQLEKTKISEWQKKSGGEISFSYGGDAMLDPSGEARIRKINLKLSEFPNVIEEITFSQLSPDVYKGFSQLLNAPNKQKKVTIKNIQTGTVYYSKEYVVSSYFSLWLEGIKAEDITIEDNNGSQKNNSPPPPPPNNPPPSDENNNSDQSIPNNNADNNSPNPGYQKPNNNQSTDNSNKNNDLSDPTKNSLPNDNQPNTDKSNKPDSELPALDTKKITNAENIETAQLNAQQQIQALFTKSKLKPSDLDKSLWNNKENWETYLQGLTTNQAIVEFSQLLEQKIKEKQKQQSIKTPGQSNFSRQTLIWSLVGGGGCLLLITIIVSFFVIRNRRKKIKNNER